MKKDEHNDGFVRSNAEIELSHAWVLLKLYYGIGLTKVLIGMSVGALLVELLLMQVGIEHEFEKTLAFLVLSSAIPFYGVVVLVYYWLSVARFSRLRIPHGRDGGDIVGIHPSTGSLCFRLAQEELRCIQDASASFFGIEVKETKAGIMIFRKNV